MYSYINIFLNTQIFIYKTIDIYIFKKDTFAIHPSVTSLRKCVDMMCFSSPELFRISTFARFPASGVTERSLAKAGWFYTGVGDRVQCFRCNVTAEGWQTGDCPTEKHRQLSSACSFIQSLPSTANLLSSAHSAFSPLRIAPSIPVRSLEVILK